MIPFIKRMKKIEVDNIVDFLRRILESNSLNEVQAKDEKYFKSIYYRISEDDYLWIYISDENLSYSDKHISKDMELSEFQKHDILHYFYKILEKKEEQAFSNLDRLCRYKATDVDFV
jgi:hypothetical protein